MPDLNFEYAMQLEHCSKHGCDTPFTTPNYKLTTTPRHEWDLVVHSGTTQGATAEEMKGNRRIPGIDDLLHSDAARKAKLTRHEVIALVLYTGPMVRRRGEAECGCDVLFCN